VHIINLPARSEGSNAVIPRDMQLEKISQQELNKLSKNLQSDYGPLLELETICQHGFLMATMNELVNAKMVELVIMGTHGASNFLDNLIGSNTSLFIKDAPCPVLAVPSQAYFTGFKNITYASGFESDETIFLQ
jgi:nucleotide-binding universal stress UspA family protein